MYNTSVLLILQYGIISPKSRRHAIMFSDSDKTPQALHFIIFASTRLINLIKHVRSSFNIINVVYNTCANSHVYRQCENVQ